MKQLDQKHIFTDTMITTNNFRLSPDAVLARLAAGLELTLGHLVHVPNSGGVAGSEDFACATLPTTPLDFQGKI